MIHWISTWLFLIAIGGEEKITSIAIFPYYYITTATSVGYGDFSPCTTTGRMIGAFYILPGAVALFAAVIGKVTSALTDFWRKGMQGKKDYSDFENHVILIGWHGERSEKMVNMLYKEMTNPKILVCTTDQIENPLPDKITFVRGDAYSKQTLKRAGLNTASRIIIYGKDDVEALATSMMICEVKGKNTHLIVHFRDLDNASSLIKHHPEVECTSSMTIETLVRSTIDPGSSLVISDLLSSDGQSQKVVSFPVKFYYIYGELLTKLHDKLGILPIAIGNAKTGMILNPSSDYRIENGEYSMWYIGNRSISTTELLKVI